MQTFLIAIVLLFILLRARSKGARPCPPEDCGGVWGYTDFVEAIQNKDHEPHEELLERVGDRFDSEAFDAAAATKTMRKGLSDWRRMV